MQPATRRYFQDGHYQADAARMAAAGWRVVNVYREPSNAIVATYAPVPTQPLAQVMEPGTPSRTVPLNPTHGPAAAAGPMVVPAQWEYMRTSIPFPPKVTGMIMSIRLGTEAQARTFFWSELNSSQFFMSTVQRELQPLYDQGWQSTYQLGPANVETRTRRIFMQDVIQWILIVIMAATIILIPLAFIALLRNYRPAYEPSAFTIELKRMKPGIQ